MRLLSPCRGQKKKFERKCHSQSAERRRAIPMVTNARSSSDQEIRGIVLNRAPKLLNNDHPSEYEVEQSTRMGSSVL